MKYALGVLLAAAIGLTACSSVNPQVAQAVESRLHELVQDFADDLEMHIIPSAHSADELLSLGLAVSSSEYTYNAEAVKLFHVKQLAKQNTSLTFAFAENGFEVSRIVFEGDFGFYMRYLHDPSRIGAEFPVVCQFVDASALSEDEAQNSIALSLLRDKKTVAVITFCGVE
ncbi:MAG: hypothetical protein FWH02_04620 [Oscillospiraceae bacterium]|nr:hypothetical protein [Oscillospiraceae bacterium]